MLVTISVGPTIQNISIFCSPFNYIFRIEELEEFSCTATTQAWGKEKEGIKAIYEAEPSTSFYHQSKARITNDVVFSYKTNQAVDDKNFERFVNCKSDII